MSRCADMEGVVVTRVHRGSPAERAGLCAGDRLLAVNATPLRDAIDFQFLVADEELALDLERGGKVQRVRIHRVYNRDLGVELAPPTPGEIQTCANRCVFCFIHQLPRGLRKDLYVKDDDFRLSFLHGNYITLTDLKDEELRRIEAQRLSPLYVSVHATQPELRHAIMGTPRHFAGHILERMERLAKSGIEMHAQIVLCPGLNDGVHLYRTVHDLARLHPKVSTITVVPVGLTRNRDRLPNLRPISAEEARRTVSRIEAWQRRFVLRLGNRLVYAADELYIMAGTPLPPASAYEGFPVIEDGVGLARKFIDEWEQATRVLPPGVHPPRAVSIATGKLFAPLLSSLLGRLRSVRGLTVHLYPVPNDLFGPGITVAGLMVGEDIIRHLSTRPLGDLLLVPGVALREDDGVFLDDLTIRDLKIRLGVPIKAPDPHARPLLASVLGL